MNAKNSAKVMRACFAVAVVTLAGVADADTQRNYSASECEGYTNSDSIWIVRSNQGCYYNSPDDCSTPRFITAILPISGNQSTSVTYSDAKVHYQLPANQTLRCYVNVTYRNGSVASSWQSDVKVVIAPSTPATSVATIDWGNSGSALSELPRDGLAMTDVLFQHIVCEVYASSWTPDFEQTCVHFGGKSSLLGYQVTTVNP
jgi:hypothetical protein